MSAASGRRPCGTFGWSTRSTISASGWSNCATTTATSPSPGPRAWASPTSRLRWPTPTSRSTRWRARASIRSPRRRRASSARWWTVRGCYRSAIESYASDRVAFETASDAGLVALATLQDEATKLDTVGEQLSEGALLSVGGATSTATLILIAVLLGVGAVGLALSVAAIRVMRELRGLEAAQGETASALAAALRSKTDFIADASHELRTPLTVLRGNAEVALAVGPAGCDYDEVLREIVTESERMTRLVGDLLTLARYDSESMPLELRAVDLEPWLAEVAARGEVLVRSRGASLLAQLQASGQARLDTGRIEQVVMIVIDNAAAFSPPHAPVRLATRVAKGHLIVEVSDQGRGSPPRRCHVSSTASIAAIIRAAGEMEVRVLGSPSRARSWTPTPGASRSRACPARAPRCACSCRLPGPRSRTQRRSQVTSHARGPRPRSHEPSRTRRARGGGR